jgi:tetratricopeptide (TPR) repeat protein
MTTICYGQSQAQAKKWFTDGDYAKAKPAFAKLIKSNPKNGSLNYWYGVCLNETGEHEKALPYLRQAIERDVENAYRYIGDYYMQDGDYDLAIENYEIYLDKVDPTDKRFAEYTRILEQARHEYKFVKRVEKVIFVDSIVVPKEKFIEAYQIGQECGTISTTRYLIGGSSEEGTACSTEMRDKIYYSDIDANGTMQLYMCYKMLDEWSKPTPLQGMPEGDNNYPYMLSDGVTIYFSNNNSEGLGGYDIYITRYNTATDRFLMAENVGMPFNSTANDYMMVIDEINKLGWFATDRNQPDSLVCIYTFIPNDTKEFYDYESGNHIDILNAARIHSICATQTDEAKVRTAQQNLLKLTMNIASTEKKEEFTFVIDDYTDYHSLKDFKNPEAKQMYIDWGTKKKQLNELHKKLESKRTSFTQSTLSEREKMSDELLKMEQQYESLETEVNTMPRTIRNKEISYSNKK